LQDVFYGSDGTRTRDLRRSKCVWPAQFRRLNCQHDMPICRDFYGSDGTRTRDLRRDRPVMALPGWAGVGGDSRREQGFPCGGSRGLAGACGSFRRPLRDVCGMRVLTRPAARQEPPRRFPSRRDFRCRPRPERWIPARNASRTAVAWRSASIEGERRTHHLHPVRRERSIRLLRCRRLRHLASRSEKRLE
jgi:hypothetical protein